jgi:hypothetical protein
MARPVYLQQRTYVVTAGTTVECQKLPLSRAFFGRRRNHVKAFVVARAVQDALASQVQ